MSAPSAETSTTDERHGGKIPLYIKILIAVVLGTILGVAVHEEPPKPDSGKTPDTKAELKKETLPPSSGPVTVQPAKANAEKPKTEKPDSAASVLIKVLSTLGQMIIKLLKCMATPLILFAVLDAFLKFDIPAKKGLTLMGISAFNAVVAIIIGLSVANVLHSGERWQGKIDLVLAQANPEKQEVKAQSVDPFAKALEFVPNHILEPLITNNVITLVVIAILMGAALRQLKLRGTPDTKAGVATIEHAVHATFSMFTKMLGWIVQIIPLAVFGVVTGVVGKNGLSIFLILGIFLATVLLGLFIHAVVYYSLLLSTVGRTSPLRFFYGAMDSIVTALSTGSSLVSLPVTLRCLNDKLKITPGSARLAACVGTNLNHAGIILYEAATTVFVAQALGMQLSLGQQVLVAFTSIVVGVGIAGVPDAGWITLPLVLGAGGIPIEKMQTIVPLLLAVDWIIGRCRAATNVISDMTVATLLDRFDPPAQSTPELVAAPVAPSEFNVLK